MFAERPRLSRTRASRYGATVVSEAGSPPLALVVVDDRFPGVEALARAAVTGLTGRWRVKMLKVADQPAAMTTAERAAYATDDPALDPVVVEHGRLLRTAGAVIVVYPTIANGLSAPVKGWLDRVLLPGVAFVLDERRNRMRPGLGHVRLLAGLTLDSRGPIERVGYHDNGRRVIARALRLVCGVRTRVRWIRLPLDADAEPSADDLSRVTARTARW